MSVSSPMDRKRIQQFGKIVLDFANAVAVDEACYSFFKNIQNIFHFPSSFTEQIEKAFPSLNSVIKSLAGTDRKLLELMFEEKRTIAHLNKQFGQIEYSLEDYDPHRGTLRLLSLSWERRGPQVDGSTQNPQDDNHTSAGFLQTMKLLGVAAVDGPISVRIDLIKDEIKDALATDTWDRINQLMEIGRGIGEIKSALPEARYKELRTYSEKESEISNLYKLLEKIQSDIREILDSVIGGSGLNEVPAFLNFLKIYNSMQTGKLTISADGSLTPISPISEKTYFAVDGIDGWFDALLDDVAYCMIEYFRFDRSSKCIRRCPQCQRYFLAIQSGRQKYCKVECRRQWNKIKAV